MKKVYIFFMIFVMLLGSMGTSKAEPSNNIVSLDILSEVSPNFNVTIEVVSGSIFSDKEIVPTGKVYDVHTKNQLALLSVIAKFSGYTNWNLGNVTVPKVTQVIDLGNSTITIGQYFLMVDDNVRILSDFTISQGIPLSLTLGDHIVTILYIGKDADLGTVFDHESIIVRVRAEGEEFEEYNLVDVPVNLQILDTFVEGTVTANVIFETGQSMYRNIAFEPTASTESFSINNEDYINYDNVILPTNNGHNMTASFIVNSTGFDGIQMMGEWEATQGITFFVDALGIHEEIPESVSIHNGLNYIGVYTFSPYGLWHGDLIHGNDSLMKANTSVNYADWDGILVDWAGQADVYAFFNLYPDSSFDFLGESSGVFINAAVGVPGTLIVDDDGTIEFPDVLIGVTIILIILVIFMIRRRRMKS
ncbi:MAG: hypothetical protein GPJ54_02900 [Candidatus Heimdallarchaeota archaeon]|nr:hypothetical protein [Candidatus Heimdallarchaeota archaeon]